MQIYKIQMVHSWNPQTFKAMDISTDVMQVNGDITDMYACIYIQQCKPSDLSL